MPQPTETLDRNMAARPASDGLVWRDLRELGVEGRGFDDTESHYDRFPARARGVVPDPVWQLSLQTAGMACRFVTDARLIAARWRLRLDRLAMWHMPSSAVSGLDLYARHQGQWRWMGVSRTLVQFPDNSATLVEDLAPQRRECMVYLPLYNGVEKVEIGVPAEASLEAAPPRPPQRARPICFYGTSILQGASASRPGMAHTNILGRRLDRPILNFGFSGNGKMEIEVARFLAELDPAVYVIDCLPNMTAELVDQRLIPLAQCLRQAHPQTPMVFVDSLIYQDAPFRRARYDRCHGGNEAQRRAVGQLTASGMTGIHHIPGDDLVGQDGEATVDGTHMTDLGFHRMADALEPVLRRLLPE